MLVVVIMNTRVGLGYPYVGSSRSTVLQQNLSGETAQSVERKTITARGGVTHLFPVLLWAYFTEENAFARHLKLLG